ncbi:DUF933 domain-containing protein [Candidatus Omnitrophota bacterium]
MKIGIIGLDLDPGKIKYGDPRLKALEEKVAAKKVTPFFVELIKDDLAAADSLICSKAKVLDMIIPDMEMIEKRMSTVEDEAEKKLLARCSKALEEGGLLGEIGLAADEQVLLSSLRLLTLKACLVVEGAPADVGELLKRGLDKAGIIFFYTVAKAEARNWPVVKGTTVVEAAGKIHSDLARGFIKAEIVNFDDLMSAHNIQEVRSKGLAKVVDKEYLVQDGDIIEIRFNV